MGTSSGWITQQRTLGALTTWLNRDGMPTSVKKRASRFTADEKRHGLWTSLAVAMFLLHGRVAAVSSSFAETASRARLVSGATQS
jgi:hypothetical protein